MREKLIQITILIGALIFPAVPYSDDNRERCKVYVSAKLKNPTLVLKFEFPENMKPELPIQTTPNGNLIVYHHGAFFFMDGRDGRIKNKISWPIAKAPLISQNGRVFLGLGTSNLFIYDQDGNEVEIHEFRNQTIDAYGMDPGTDSWKILTNDKQGNIKIRTSNMSNHPISPKQFEGGGAGPLELLYNFEGFTTDQFKISDNLVKFQQNGNIVFFSQVDRNYAADSETTKQKMIQGGHRLFIVRDNQRIVDRSLYKNEDTDSILENALINNLDDIFLTFYNPKTDRTRIHVYKWMNDPNNPIEYIPPDPHGTFPPISGHAFVSFGSADKNQQIMIIGSPLKNERSSLEFRDKSGDFFKKTDIDGSLKGPIIEAKNGSLIALSHQKLDARPNEHHLAHILDPQGIILAKIDFGRDEVIYPPIETIHGLLFLMKTPEGNIRISGYTLEEYPEEITMTQQFEVAKNCPKRLIPGENCPESTGPTENAIKKTLEAVKPLSEQPTISTERKR